MANRNPGPFLKSFFIPDKRIERIAEECLNSVGLMPTSPGPVAIERYCEKRWGFPENYVNLPSKVLGTAIFTTEGLIDIIVDSKLGDDTSPIGIIRTRSTIAHEIGHGELHEEAYVAKLIHDNTQGDLFTKPTANSSGLKRIATACREDQIFGSNRDEWWESQANKFMAALLMPPTLLRQVFDAWNKEFPPQDWPPVCPLEVEIADIFKVSQKMASIAAKGLREKQAKDGNSLRIATEAG